LEVIRSKAKRRKTKKQKKMTGGKQLKFYGYPQAEHYFIQPVDEHDAGLVVSTAEKLEALCGHQNFCIVTVPVVRWNRDLTPWENPPVFGKESFGSGAEDTLNDICAQLIPSIREMTAAGKRSFYLCGYSLAGLFALWSAYQTDVFAGVAAVSPSVWYPGWTDYAAAHPIKTKQVYLSLGDKEEKAKNRLMATVGDAIRSQYRLLTEAGISCTLEWNEGNHFIDSDVRMAKGMAWILNRLREES